MLRPRSERRLDDRILRIETGKSEHAHHANAGDGERSRHHRPEGQRDMFPERAIITHVLFMVHRVDHRASAKEQQRLEKGMGEQVEHRRAIRSEEHTSEPQSLMRISYAVFCLKKNKHKRTTNNTS